MTTATTTLGDFQVTKINDDLGVAYELTEGGDVYDYYNSLKEARDAAQRFTNAHLESAIIIHVDDNGVEVDDAMEALLNRAYKLGESAKPEAETELREILARLKAGI